MVNKYLFNLKNSLVNLFSSIKKYIIEYLLSMPREVKYLLVLLVDMIFCIFSVLISFYLRLEEFQSFGNTFSPPVLITSAVSLAIMIPIFLVSGIYRAIFRYNGISAMINLTLTNFIYGATFFAVITFIGVQGVPRTIGIIQPIVLFMSVLTTRTSARILLGNHYRLKIKKSSLPQALIYGAGKIGRQFAFGMANSSEMNVVGYLDDDVRLHGRILNGLHIYNPSFLKEIAKKKGITDILLAIPSASHDRRNQILANLSKLNISVRKLPDLSDVAFGKVAFTEVRELDIDDLLGRREVKPNKMFLSKNTLDKTVLITGAGGSIGSELCRQVLKNKPRLLLLVDMSEFALYQINQEIRANLELLKISQDEEIEVVPLLASVYDEKRMQEVMKTWKPHTVYHAAAYKHVPLVEHNPGEAVRNNVWGTMVCAEAALQNDVENFVLISTDKAVRPTNLMGATKRLAEMVLQALNTATLSDQSYISKKKNKASISRTCFSIVRFGNVLGSSGSVVPLFREQIKKGGPVTLTHLEITRYFMTIQEAAQLVIQAGSMGTGGDVFVLDMGEPVRIYDLAVRMVELSGLTHITEKNKKGDIEIKVTGLRPGEKLYEELLIVDNSKPTIHPRILRAYENYEPWEQLKVLLHSLKMAITVNDVPLIRDLLKQLVAGYKPNDKIVDWVYLEQERQAAGI